MQASASKSFNFKVIPIEQRKAAEFDQFDSWNQVTPALTLNRLREERGYKFNKLFLFHHSFTKENFIYNRGGILKSRLPT